MGIVNEFAQEAIRVDDVGYFEIRLPVCSLSRGEFWEITREAVRSDAKKILRYLYDALPSGGGRDSATSFSYYVCQISFYLRNVDIALEYLPFCGFDLDMYYRLENLFIVSEHISTADKEKLVMCACSVCSDHFIMGKLVKLMRHEYSY